MEPRSTSTAAGHQSNVMVVILTLNEAKRLPGCLAAIPPGYPVTVVDSGSSDGTADIAWNAGARVLINPWPGYVEQRNFSLDACRGLADWVLFIDTDEIFPPAFFEWLEAAVSQTSCDFDVVLVPSVLIWNGQPLRHAPGYPILHHRLLRVETVRFVHKGTGHGETVAETWRQVTCPIPYDHFFYDGDLASWMRKHVNYARYDVFAQAAEETAYITDRARLNRLGGRGIWRIPARFFYHYVWLGGFRDGHAGLAYALMYAWYEATKWTLRRAGRRP